MCERAPACARTHDDDVVLVGHDFLLRCGRLPGPAVLDDDVRDVLVVVAPGDAVGRGRGLDRGGVIAVEVVPCPGHEGVGLAVRAAQQHRVDAEPGREGDRALDLVPVLADLGDGGVAADHRHDALVLVLERLGGLAVSLTQDVLGGPPAGLLRDRSQLRERGTASPSGCSRRRRRRTPRDSPRRSGRAARPGVRRGREWGRRPAPPRSAGFATAPDDRPGRDGAAVVELDAVGVHRCDAHSQPGDSARARQLARGHSREPCGERTEQRVPAIDDGDLCPGARSRPVACSARISSDSAPAVSTPVGPPPTTTTSSRPCVGLRCWSAPRQQLLEVSTKPLGVGDRVQRERVLRRARNAEEVRAGTGRHHHVRSR